VLLCPFLAQRQWLLCTILQTAASKIVTPQPTPASVSVCVSVRNHISVTTHPIFTNFLYRLPIATAPFTAGVAGKLCTSSFTDYVIFPHNGSYGGMSILSHWVTSLCRHALPNAPDASYWLHRSWTTAGVETRRVYFARGYGGKACNASVPCRFQNWQLYWFWTLLWIFTSFLSNHMLYRTDRFTQV